MFEYYICHRQEVKAYDENENPIRAGICGLITNDIKRIQGHQRAHGAMRILRK